MEQLTAEKYVDVSFSDIDAMHIVWHGNYVKYFEEAREHFGKKYNFGYMDFMRSGYMTPLVDIQLSYIKMLEYGERIKICVTYEAVKTVKIVFHYKIYNQKNELVCTGKTTQVIINKNRNLVLKNPDLKKDLESKWRIKNEKNAC